MALHKKGNRAVAIFMVEVWMAFMGEAETNLETFPASLIDACPDRQVTRNRGFVVDNFLILCLFPHDHLLGFLKVQQGSLIVVHISSPFRFTISGNTHS